MRKVRCCCVGMISARQLQGNLVNSASSAGVICMGAEAAGYLHGGGAAAAAAGGFSLTCNARTKSSFSINPEVLMPLV